MWGVRAYFKEHMCRVGCWAREKGRGVCAEATIVPARGNLAVTTGAAEMMWRGQRSPALDGDLMGGLGKESRPRRHLEESIHTMIHIGKDRVG